MTRRLLIIVALAALGGCPASSSQTQTHAPKPAATKTERSADRVALRTFSDVQYPDNPSIGYRARDYNRVAHPHLSVRKNHAGRFDIVVAGGHGASRVTLRDIDLRHFMPAIPPHLRDHRYLSLITIVNQEWNRQQVRFERGGRHVVVSKRGYDDKHLVRVDLARNCLNSRLWELFLVRRVAGAQRTYFHGWFEFPRALYARLFRQVNAVPFSKYARVLDKWVDPPREKVAFSRLRRVLTQRRAELTARNDRLYPLVGERKKKHKNIVAPQRVARIDDLLDDRTRFATFAPPGLYKRSDPRVTKLGRLARPQRATLRVTVAPFEKRRRLEIDIALGDRAGKRRTRLVIGGLDLRRIPRRSVAEHHRGYQMPMGVANHTFYASYADTVANPVHSSPYFGLLVDGDGRFLDSHRVGIDGPLLHRDAKDDGLLHVWVLSFERHALVGHYLLRIPRDLRALLEGRGPLEPRHEHRDGKHHGKHQPC